MDEKLTKHKGLRKCRLCRRWEVLSNFHKDLSKKDGFRHECKTCRLKQAREYYNTAKRKEFVSRYIKLNKTRRRNNTLRYMYNLSIEDYEQMLFRQNGKCAICGKVEERKSSPFLCVDHCHKTGKIRGLLCHRCNSAIGKLNDDPELLRKAIVYLEYKW